MKTLLKNLLENTDLISGKVFAYFIQFLIIVSIVTFSIDTLPNLSQKTKNTGF